MWSPGMAPPGLNWLITPANLSAQSLGRKVFPSWVMPRIINSLELGDAILEGRSVNPGMAVGLKMQTRGT